LVHGIYLISVSIKHELCQLDEIVLNFSYLVIKLEIIFVPAVLDKLLSPARM